MITKQQLIAHYKGGPKGKAHAGTIVRLVRDVEMGTRKVRYPAGLYEVKHLMDHTKGYEDVVAVWFKDDPRGLCISLPLAELEIA